MTIVNIDLRQFSGETPGDEPAPNAQVWFSPYRPYHVEDGSDDYLMTSQILKVKCPEGVAAPDLPPTPALEAVWVQTRNVRGADRWLVQIPATECNLFDLPRIDPDSLDPLVPPTPYWLTYMNDAIAEAIDGILDGAPAAMDTLAELAAALGDDPNFATTIIASLASKVDQTTYAAAIAAINTAVGLKADDADLTAESEARAEADALLQPIATLAAAIDTRVGAFHAGPTLPAYDAGTHYVWNKTDAVTGDLIDIITGVAS